MRGRSSAVVLLLAASLLAGCIGATESPGSPSPLTAASEPLDENTTSLPVASDGPPGRAITLPTQAPLNASRTFEGSFAPHEACLVSCPAEAVAGEELSSHRYDITELVPRGIPTLLDITLDSDQAGGAAWISGSLKLEIVTPDGVWDDDENALGAHDEGARVVVTRVSEGPVEIVVTQSTPEPDQPALSYTLELASQVQADRLSAGVPLAVQLSGPGDGLQLHLPGDREEAVVSLWGPDDALVGRYTVGQQAGQLTLPEGAPAGEHVLLLHDARTGLELTSLSPDQAPPPIRILNTEALESQPVALDDQGRASWSFDVPTPPLYVQVTLETGQASWIGGLSAAAGGEMAKLTVEGPAGLVLGDEDAFWANCVLCVPPTVMTWDSTLGDPAHLAGTYTVDLQTHGSPGGQASSLAVVWTR